MQHNKYLIVDEDKERINQSRDRSSQRAYWAYELVEGKPNVIRLRSTWSNRYLDASEDCFLLGMTGKKVFKTINQGPTSEWEPMMEGSYIKLKSHTGSFLRANPRIPPWRNSVTHDESGNWTATDNMILWIVDEIDHQSIGRVSRGSTNSMEDVTRSNVPSLPDDVVDQESAHSSEESFSKLKSLLNALDDELDIRKTEETSSGYCLESSSEHIHPIQVAWAKQTLKELKGMDFNTIISSEREENLDKALKLLIAESKMSNQGNICTELVNLEEQLMVLKNKHDLASQDLDECTKFCTRRSEIMEIFKQDAAKARELQAVQVKLETARARREELLKQINEIETVIKDVEKFQASSIVEVEDLIFRMGQTKQKLEEMKIEDKCWQVRKIDANRTLESIQEEWVQLETLFPDD